MLPVVVHRRSGTLLPTDVASRRPELSWRSHRLTSLPDIDLVFLDENTTAFYGADVQAVVFNALGEPNRLRIVELLRTSSFAVGEIAETLGIRQPQVSKHLKVLAESGIVRVEPRARQRIYHLRAEPFDQIARWVDSFEHLWEVRLGSLGDYLRANETEEDRP